MIRITQSESSTAAQNYFGQSLSRGDYYLDGQEIAGGWGGRGAALLGLAGPLQREAFMALLENKRPDGSRLTSRTVANRRPGYDFTFDVPKSVSIVHALTGDGRILEAMRKAIDETMREMEEEMHARVRKSGAFEDRKTANMVWAQFIHLTSRPASLDQATVAALNRSPELLEHLQDAAGRSESMSSGGLAVPDPHLHSHVYVINATYDEVEELWKAGEFMRLKRDATYYQAAYHVRLAGELQRLGYTIEPTANAFEIAGIARSIIEIFSRRTKEVERAAEELGITSDAEKDKLGALTRRHKNSHLGMMQLKKIWRAMLKPEERRHIALVTAAAFAMKRAIAKDSPDAAHAALRYALGHELERASEVSERRLLARALMRAVGQSSVATVGRELNKIPGLESGLVDGERHFTTREVLLEESALLAMVRYGRGRVPPLRMAQYSFNNALFRNESPDAKEQRDAILHVLHSQDWVLGIVGRAGTGKTTILQEIRTAMESSGRKLIVCAPTAEASRGVLRAEGFEQADTIQRLLADEALHEQMKGNVLWVDEAGMIGNRDMLALLELAKRKGVARVVLSGDPTQIRSVARGDAFHYLEKNAGLSVARLDKIKRQKDPALKQVIEAMSRGESSLGLELLDKNKCVVEAPAKEAWKALAQTYVARISQRASVLVVSPTHVEGAAITKAIRSDLKAHGLLARAEKTLPRTVNLSWTQAQRGNAASYEPGLLVQFKQNAKGFRKSERVRVTEVSARKGAVRVLRNDGEGCELPLKDAQNFQVYAVHDLPVSVGDRLRITENGYVQTAEEGARARVSNGDLVCVTGFNAEGGVELENGKALPHDFGHLDHGYVSTADAAQSKTVDTVLAGIGQDSIAATDLRRTYVTLSRARNEARVFTEDKTELMRAAKRQDERRSATDLVGDARRRKIVRQMNIREAQRQEQELREAILRRRVVVPEREITRPEMEIEYGR